MDLFAFISVPMALTSSPDSPHSFTLPYSLFTHKSHKSVRHRHTDTHTLNIGTLTRTFMHKLLSLLSSPTSCPGSRRRWPLAMQGVRWDWGDAVFRAARRCGGRTPDRLREPWRPFRRQLRQLRGLGWRSAGGAGGGASAAGWRWPSPAWRGLPPRSARSRGSPGSRPRAAPVAGTDFPLWRVERSGDVRFCQAT